MILIDHLEGCSVFLLEYPKGEALGKKKYVGEKACTVNYVLSI